MSEFTLRKAKSITVKNPDGEILREFTLDVGNYQQMKDWQAKIAKINALQEKLKDGEDHIDDLVALEKEIVETTVGDWEWIWQATGQNVYSVMEFIRHISDHIHEEVKARTSAFL